ncbi:MAG: inositol monophosphatase family protein, partial [Planctomycetaceae bacterium]
GAFWQIGSDAPRPARVSTVSSLSEATFCTTTIQGWARIHRQDAFDQLCTRAAICRGWGDCYGHALVATGRADLMVDPLLNPWDCAPFVPILQEAGGHFVNFDGVPDIHSGNGLSVNQGLLETALDVVRQV